MKIKSFKTPDFGLLLLVISMLLFSGCGSGSGNKSKKAEEPEIELDVSELDQSLFQDIGEVKKIFYSMPSPLETAMMIQSAGATYNEELLNSLDNANNYTTNKGMALNLGIYTCDMSFASLYDQTETSINYMSAAKKMADGLGILDAINNETIQDLEDNINNRDKIMEIISDTFMNSSSYLQDNDRGSVASIVLVGGWMEGLYIATQMILTDSLENNPMVKRIMDQKLSLDIVIKLLDESKDNADVQGVLDDVKDLKASFDKIVMSTTPIKTSTDPETNVTTLKSTTKSNMSPELFEEIKGKIKIIRNKYIS